MDLRVGLELELRNGHGQRVPAAAGVVLDDRHLGATLGDHERTWRIEGRSVVAVGEVHQVDGSLDDGVAADDDHRAVGEGGGVERRERMVLERQMAPEPRLDHVGSIGENPRQ